MDYVGHKFSSPCEDFALVRLSLPAAAGTSSSGTASGAAAAPPASFQLAYMKVDCLGYDPTLNK